MKKLLKILLLLILTIFVGISAFLFIPNRILSKATVKERLTLPTSHFMQWREAEIHYTATGNGPLVLMVHGFGGSHRNFDSLTTLLSNEYKIVRVDLPGFGMSDMPKVEGGGKELVQMYHDFMQFFVDSLHADSLYVIGNSLGGWVTWEMASKDTTRIKKIVLLNSAGYEVDKVLARLMPPIRIKVTKLLSYRGLPLFMSKKGVENCWANPSKSNPQAAVDANTFMNREGNIGNFLRLAESLVMPDTSKIKKLECPALVIWGDKDKIIPVSHAEKFKRDLPHNQTIVFKDCGHIPQIEMPVETANAVRIFFKKGL